MASILIISFAFLIIEIVKEGTAVSVLESSSKDAQGLSLKHSLKENKFCLQFTRALAMWMTTDFTKLEGGLVRTGKLAGMARPFRKAK